jgi:hypothetical protein
MDGTPCKGEVIPVRFLLSGADLTISYDCEKFKVKYFFVVMMTGEEGSKYYKKFEI